MITEHIQPTESSPKMEATETVVNMGTTEEATEVVTIEKVIESESAQVKHNWEATEIELLIFELFKGSETTTADQEKILEVIDQINWSKYDQLTMETEFRCHHLLYWLSTITLENDDDIVSILMATDGLDGYMSDSYSSVLSMLYLKDPMRLIKLMSPLEEKQIEHLSYLIVYGLWEYNLEELDKMFSDVEVLLGQDAQYEAEKKVIKSLRNVVKRQLEDITMSNLKPPVDPLPSPAFDTETILKMINLQKSMGNPTDEAYYEQLGALYRLDPILFAKMLSNLSDADIMTISKCVVYDCLKNGNKAIEMQKRELDLSTRETLILLNIALRINNPEIKYLKK